MNDINFAIAHILHTDGTLFQVLNSDGTDWDEEATRIEYEEYINSKGA